MFFVYAIELSAVFFSYTIVLKQYFWPGLLPEFFPIQMLIELQIAIFSPHIAPIQINLLCNKSRLKTDRNPQKKQQKNQKITQFFMQIVTAMQLFTLQCVSSFHSF